jgi:hypothetical protein
MLNDGLAGETYKDSGSITVSVSELEVWFGSATQFGIYYRIAGIQ